MFYSFGHPKPHHARNGPSALLASLCCSIGPWAYGPLRGPVAHANAMLIVVVQNGFIVEMYVKQVKRIFRAGHVIAKGMYVNQ